MIQKSSTSPRRQSAEEREAALDAYAEAIAAAAPPLTESQKDHIRRIFQPVTTAGYGGLVATSAPRTAEEPAAEPTVLACGPDESRAEFIARIVATAPPLPDDVAVHLAALLPLGQTHEEGGE
jgi:hypothetical protein